MNRYLSKTICFSVITVIGVLLIGSSVHAAEATDGYALLIQQSPIDAGSVTPGAGVHKIQIGDTVSLSAIPKPGYRFLYWLGDVSAADATSTTIQVDSPKLVVAVFTRQAYEEELPGVQLIKGTVSGGGGGHLIGTPLSTPAAISPGNYYDGGNLTYINNITPTDFYDDVVPVPEGGNDNVPEPTTVLLLGLGASMVLRYRKR
jgi:hypothetical protein